MKANPTRWRGDLVRNRETTVCRRLRQSLRCFAALAFILSSPARGAEDLIVDGVTRTITDGTYRMVLVKNAGTLVVNGNLSAEEILVVTAGVLSVSQNVRCPVVSIDGTASMGGDLLSSNLTVVAGTTTATGVSNRVDRVDVGGRLVALGNWQVKHLTIVSNAVLRVYSVNSGVPRSGTLSIFADTVHVDSGGTIDANYCGADPRGQGHDWYANSDGGGHIGRGGRGYWDSSGGNEGPAFEPPFTYEANMGGAGGALGGGAVLIEAEIEFILDGSILANGQPGPHYSWGGGGGGGILVRSPAVTLNGWMSARGGNGGSHSGGGGGGGVKICYGNDTLPSFSSRADASGGYAGGYLNTQPGQPGAVYRDHIPRVNQILSPAVGEVVTNGIIFFRFTVLDLSEALDGRRDSLSALIELSTDGFTTVAYSFNQATDLSGWSRPVYFSGDLAQYVPLVVITNGVYQWRIALRDGSLYSRYTTPRTFAVGTTVPIQGIAADICLTPTVIIRNAVGTTCRIDYVSSLAEPTAWRPLATIPVTRDPELYFDAAAIAEPTRFYRIIPLP